MKDKILIFDILTLCGITDHKGIHKVEMTVTPTDFDIYIERHFHHKDRTYHITNNSNLLKQTEYIRLPAQ